MCDSRVQELATQLLEALGTPVVCGAITLNVNESTVQSVDTRTHYRVTKKGRNDNDDKLRTREV